MTIFLGKKPKSSKFCCILCLTLSIYLFPIIVYAQEIAVEKLEQIPLDSLGIDNNISGLPDDMWNKISFEYAKNLINQLPTSTSSHTAQKLIRSILLNKSKAPENSESGSLLKLRLKKLSELGEFSNVKRILNTIPQSLIDEDLAKIEVNNFVLLNDNKTACEKGRIYLETFSDSFWQKINLFCFAIEGKSSELDLGIKLYNELHEGWQLPCCKKSAEELLQNISRGNNIEISESIIEDKENIEIQPIELGILSAAGINFSPKFIKKTNPGINRFVALNSKSSIENKILAAEMSLVRGSIGFEELTKIYMSHEWSGRSNDIENSNPILSRAILTQLLYQSETPSIEVLKSLRKNLFESELIALYPILISEKFSELSKDIYERGDLVVIADQAILSLLATGKFYEANNWFRMLEIYEERNELASIQAKKVRPFIKGFVPIPTSWDPKFSDEWWNTFSEENLEQKAITASKIFSLVHSFRNNTPVGFWGKINKYYNENNSSYVTQSNIISGFKSAAQNSHSAETISLAAILIGQNKIQNIPESVMSDIVRGLLFIDQDKSAKMLAAEYIVNIPGFFYE